MATKRKRGSVKDRTPPAAPAERVASTGKAPCGEIRHAAWLADGLLLLAATTSAKKTHWPEATLAFDDASVPAEAAGFAYDDAAVNPAAGCRPVLIVVRFPAAEGHSQRWQRLVLEGPDGRLEFSNLRPPVSVAKLLCATVAGLPAEGRWRVIDFLVSALAPAVAGRQGTEVSRALMAVREALRERLPPAEIKPGAALMGHVDLCVALDENRFYIRGWLSDRAGGLVRVTAVSPEGCRVELLDRLFRHPRVDVDGLLGPYDPSGGRRNAGFVSYFESEKGVGILLPERLVGCFAQKTPDPFFAGPGWLLEVVDEQGNEMELGFPAAVRDEGPARDTLLAESLPDYGPRTSQYRRDHLLPALASVQRRLDARTRLDWVMQYGEPPENPQVSLIVPLYGRFDFLEQQLAQFALDRELFQADLIYVLDSPELARQVFDQAPRLQRLYRLPFRVAAMQSNVGFARANNTGATLAEGRLLLLINADVFPAEPGWLGKLAAFYHATPAIGALGPKLLYEDDAIQHAGLFFYRQAADGLWNNEHYFKGFQRGLPAANVSRPVPAISAACMLIGTELYRTMGGLRGAYVQGDFEDSDLCIRLAEAGLKSWYCAEVELYHLEGQSYPGALRARTARYNQWLHTHLHDQAIEKIMADFCAREG